jgi:hypothetical protein
MDVYTQWEIADALLYGPKGCRTAGRFAQVPFIAETNSMHLVLFGM